MSEARSVGLRQGADEISEFLFGDRRYRRRIYHLVETGQLPHFKLGATICARDATLIAWIEAQERASVKLEDA